MKSTNYNRLVLIGLAAFVLLGLTLLQPSRAYAQFASPLPTPPVTPPRGVVDLAVDKNRDGVPDQLLAAIEAFEAVVTQVNLAGDISKNPEAQAVLQKAQEDFDRQMPYSATTRAQQARMTELNKALFEATDAETRQKLWGEIEALQGQMLQEPSFALVAQILNRRLSDAMNAKIAADIAASAKEAPPAPTDIPVPTAPPTTATAPAGEVIEAAGIAAPDAANGGVRTNAPVVWIRFFPRDGCGTTAAPNFGQLIRGEIMFYGGNDKVNNFFYAKKFSHIGLYDGVINNSQRVYESNPPGPVYLGGARRELLTAGWNRQLSCVAFARVNGTTPAQRESALNWAETTYGINGTTPYNYNFLNKTTDSALYCSQLVWKTFMHIGIDLDSNSTTYSNWLSLRFIAVGLGIPAALAANQMVAPDEIALSANVPIYHEGLNP